MKSRRKNIPEEPALKEEDQGPLSRLSGIFYRYDALFLFLVIYVVYNTVSRLTMSGDTNPAAFLPVSIILHQTLNFDALVGPGLGPNVAYAFPVVNGHYFSLFPIVTPILVTPIYLLSYLLFSAFQVPFDVTSVMLLAKTSATVIAALSCVVVYLTAKELFPKKIALLTALVYAFATSTWSVSSQALWQHGTVELLLILMLYLLIRNERAVSRNYFIALGLLAGLFLFNRPPDAPLLIPIIGYIFWYYRERVTVVVVSALVTGLPFLLYNFLTFGNVFGGYKENLDLFAFGTSCFGNIIGLLIAPNLGLLVFSPVLVLAFFGFLKLNNLSNPRIRQVLFVFGPVIILEILVYSLFSRWDSSVAYSYGQRFLTGFVPVLALYIGIILNEYFGDGQKTRNVRLFRVAITLLIIISVFIQAIGVFFYPLYPDRSTNEGRDWDWNNSIVVTSLIYGVSHIDEITMYSFPPLPPVFHLHLQNPG